MKKKTKIVLLVIHGLLLFVPFIIAATQLKFPVLDFARHSVHDLSLENFYPIFIGVWLLGVALVLLSEKLNKFKGFATYITVGGLIVFLMGFGIVGNMRGFGPHMYPLASTTVDVGNYLVLDVAVDSDFVKSAIPERVPESAQNIKYEYFYEPNVGNYKISVSWSLSDEDYKSEKTRFASWNNGRTANSKSISTGKNLYAMNATVEFDDAIKEIKYYIDVHYSK